MRNKKNESKSAIYSLRFKGGNHFVTFDASDAAGHSLRKDFVGMDMYILVIENANKSVDALRKSRQIASTAYLNATKPKGLAHDGIELKSGSKILLTGQSPNSPMSDGEYYLAKRKPAKKRRAKRRAKKAVR